MKRLLGKALGILLSVTMMVSLVPGMAVFAATDETGGSEVEDEVDEDAQAVIDNIKSFPAIEDLTLDDFDLVEGTWYAYIYDLDEPLQVQVQNAFPEIESM